MSKEQDYSAEDDSVEIESAAASEFEALKKRLKDEAEKAKALAADQP